MAAGDRRLALLCLGEVPFDASWKRNQSMAYELSRVPPFDRLVFVQPRPVWVKDELLRGRGGPRDRLARVLGARPRWHDTSTRILSMVHFLPGRWAEREYAALDRRVHSALGGRPFVLLDNHPCFFHRPLLEKWTDESVLSVYDLSDDFVEFYEDEASRAVHRENIEYSCRRSDLVFTVNEHVRALYGHLNPETHVVGNATNFANFDRRGFRPVPFLSALRRPGSALLGYTGVINRLRIDYELLAELLARRPDWQAVFVGSADPSFLELATRLPNLHHHPAVPYAELPDWIAGLDVAIIPFRVNEHTRGNDLLKVNDYLAMGSRIVSTDTAGVRAFGDLVRVAGGLGEFERAIEAALAEDPAHDRERRREVARERSWDRKIHEVRAILAPHLDLTP